MHEDLGTVEIDHELCKGCGLCITACVPKVLHLDSGLNHLGYRPARYTGQGCSGCGLCYFACPEPEAIRVYKRTAKAAA